MENELMFIIASSIFLIVVITLWLYTRLQIKRYRRERSEWQRLTENLPDLVLRLDRQGRFTYISPAVKNVLGFEPNLLLGEHFRRTQLPDEIKELIDGHYFEAIWTSKSQDCDVSFISPKGEMTLGVRFIPETDANGQVVGAVILAQDITRRHIEVQALQDNERQLREIFENINEVFWLRTRNKFLYISPAYEKLFGRPRQELYQNAAAFLKYIHPEDLPDVERVFAQNTTSNFKPERLTIRLIRPDGEVRSIYYRCFLAKGEDANADDIHIAGIFVDVTNLVQMEEQLREGEKRYFALFENMNESVALHELIYNDAGQPVDYRILAVNSAYVRIMGIPREQAVNSLASALYNAQPAPYLDIYAQVAQTGKPAFFGTFFESIEKHFEVSVFSPYKGYFATVSLDVTERKLMEEHLRYGQKMEAVGRLAGGIAHDFNNLLQVILGYGELLNDKASSEQKEFTKGILDASERAMRLVQQLLAFSRQEHLQLKHVSLEPLLEECRDMFERVIGRQIQIKLDVAEDTQPICVDPVQIEQILLNLCINARDFMPDGGTITLSTQNVELDFEQAAGLMDISPGRYVLLTVSDTGLGVPEEIQEKIFDPFFTTKEFGKGTGMGLATVFGIVQRHGGAVRLNTEWADGACFDIYLPVAGKEKPESGAPVNTLPPIQAGHGETVLVAEDEEDINALLTNMLIQAGYEVLSASDGVEALDLAKAHLDDIHLMLLDLVMPNINGKAVYQTLHELRPEIPVLFATGNGCGMQELGPLGLTEEHLLVKPYNRNVLLHRVANVLNSSKVT